MSLDRALTRTVLPEFPDVGDLVRPLGSRGSRGELDGAGPADLTPTAVAVLAAVAAWSGRGSTRRKSGGYA